jgi:FtsZ-binding cell division protein ZapB
MAAFNDTVTTIITIDGKQAVNQIGALEMEVKDLNTALKSIKKGTQEYIDTNNKLTEVKKNLQDVRDTVGLTGMTIKQLREEQKRLNFEMNNITRGTAAYDEYKAKIQAVTKAINDQQADVKGTKEAWQQAGGGANDMFSKVSGLLKGGVILGVATQVFQIGKEFLALTNEVNKSRESVAKFSELTGEALNNTTAKTLTKC